MDKKREKIAKLLFKHGAILFSEEGFKLKLHQTNPDAPLSPFYIDLRGVVRDPYMQEILVNYLYGFIWEHQIEDFYYIADIPLSISPLAASLAKKFERKLITLRLSEKSYGAKGSVLGNFEAKKRVLLIDDVLTKADTKLKAVEILNKKGLLPDNLIVLVDRQQGGSELIKELGVHVTSVFTWSHLYNYYFDEGLISARMIKRIQEYLGEVRK